MVLLQRVSLMTRRFLATKAQKLVFEEFGDPIKVIQKHEDDVSDPTENEVLIKMLAAPVHPADINFVQGKYPLQAVFPTVPGSEGVGKVLKTGANVNDLKVGDHVVPTEVSSGTWRTHLTIDAKLLYKVPRDLGLAEAATLVVNPCTAYRMLRDYTHLKPGDTVIQNGANSACGQNVIQISRAWGIKTVNIVRDRPDLGDLKKFLTKIGGTYVFTEEELRHTDIFRKGECERPRLAFNCVGGQNALEILRHLQSGSPMVTYGGMSREPVMVPTAALIFKDLKIVGFWMNKWINESLDSSARFKMFEELIALMLKGELQSPANEMVPFSNYKKALMNTMTVKGMTGKKFILDFTTN